LLLLALSFVSTAAFAQKASLWFEDRDGDKHGNPDVSILSINAPPGFVKNSNDCNDDPFKRGKSFYPKAKEPCNYDDFNCDGFIAHCAFPPEPQPIPPQQDVFVVTSFEPGHPFVSFGGGRDNLSNVDDIFPGLGASQSAFVQTNGYGGQKLLRAFYPKAFDFSQTMPKLWLKLRNGDKLAKLSFLVGNKNFKNFVRFNLHSHQGQQWLTDSDWLAFSVSWNLDHLSSMRLEPGMTLADLRREITDFQFQIEDNGQGPVSLGVARIGAVNETSQEFPNGVISFTFDDSWASQFHFAKPKLDQYGFPATAYVIVGFLDRPNYLTLEQLTELKQQSKWEVAFHAFDTFMHIENYTNFSEEHVERDILAGKQWLWERGFGLGQDGKHGIAHFAYPKGEFKQQGKTDVLAIIRKHFSSARTISECLRESSTPSDTHKLRVLYITAPESVEKVMQEIRAGIAAKEWIILVLHHLVENTKENAEWQISKFNNLVDLIAQEMPQVPVKTVGDVLSSSVGQQEKHSTLADFNANRERFKSHQLHAE